MEQRIILNGQLLYAKAFENTHVLVADVRVVEYGALNLLQHIIGVLDAILIFHTRFWKGPSERIHCL